MSPTNCVDEKKKNPHVNANKIGAILSKMHRYCTRPPTRTPRVLSATKEKMIEQSMKNAGIDARAGIQP